MFGQLKQPILTAPFSSQAPAMFIHPDWFDPTNPSVGTNRYAYSHNDPVNITDPNGNCTNDAACEIEWDDPTKTADDIQTEDAVADAAIHDGRAIYVLDPRELGLDRLLDIGTALQEYISSGSPACQKSDLKRTLEETIASGKPVEFSISDLPISASLFEEYFTNSGQIFGDFRVYINVNISVDGNGNYSIDGATAEKNPKEECSFEIDDKDRAIVNHFTDLAGRRSNMTGPNKSRVQSRTGHDPCFNSTYGGTNIVTELNRTYSFSAWGQYQ